MFRFFYLILIIVSLIFTIGVAPQALASVVITGTRVIYPSDANEVSVKLDNRGNNPVLVQSWIDSGEVDTKPDFINVPFIITPPVNRIDPDNGQNLRIRYTGDILPTDRESLFWLNVLEIPAKPSSESNENYIQMAFRTRIKLFYRPISLELDVKDSMEKISFNRLDNDTIRVDNPTPFHISFAKIVSNKKEIDGEMVSPYSSLDFQLPNQAGNKIEATYINDYGAMKLLEYLVK
ncbi:MULTISPECIES: molecular chaperone [Shewanella]|uniref:fimbrial biogenesis chaperone n=1 Tax=Shewanella TaxID=22 RepID=UPI001BF03962|nr:fimbria/pilus periplasmic chaperone [Shewanella sp.]BCV38571.1 fimbrial chaperone [Shewanella chilikensis]